jgi:hypothetical protein
MCNWRLAKILPAPRNVASGCAGAPPDSASSPGDPPRSRHGRGGYVCRPHHARPLCRTCVASPVSDNGAPGQKGLPQETFLPIAKTRPLGQRRHDGVAAPRPRKIEISTMLSELSYRQLRFEGRTRPLAASSVTAAGFVEPPAWHSPGSQREEPQLSPDEEAFVSAALTSAGLDSSAYRAGPVHRRLPAVLRAVRSATPIVGAARPTSGWLNAPSTRSSLDTPNRSATRRSSGSCERPSSRRSRRIAGASMSGASAARPEPS